MRNITVNNTKYLWQFKSNRDFICDAKLTILSFNRDLKMLLSFKTTYTFIAGSPLNEGLPMMRSGQCYLVNLNQPKYVIELLKYLLDYKVDLKKKVYYFDGSIILQEMGYQDVDGYLR